MRNIAIVPILDYKVVQTTKFKSPKYIGEPRVIIKQLSDMGADEIFVLDISYRINNSKIYNVHNTKFLENIVKDAFCPVGYGGGLFLNEHVNIAKEIISVGYEKIIAASAWWKNHTFYQKLSDKIGKQSVVKCLEIDDEDYENNNYEWIDDTINKEQDFGELLLFDTVANGRLSGLNPKLIDIAKKSPVPTVLAGGWNGKKVEIDFGASTYHMLYKNNVMLDYKVIR